MKALPNGVGVFLPVTGMGTAPFVAGVLDPDPVPLTVLGVVAAKLNLESEVLVDAFGNP